MSCSYFPDVLNLSEWLLVSEAVVVRIDNRDEALLVDTYQILLVVSESHSVNHVLLHIQDDLVDWLDHLK